MIFLRKIPLTLVISGTLTSLKPVVWQSEKALLCLFFLSSPSKTLPHKISLNLAGLHTLKSYQRNKRIYSWTENWKSGRMCREHRPVVRKQVKSLKK